MANFQLPEANFQVMTIFPLIQKQRQRKMLGQRTAWDCLQPNDTAWDCPASSPAPTPQCNKREGKPTYCTSLSSPSPLPSPTFPESHIALVPRSQVQPALPTPRAFVHTQSALHLQTSLFLLDLVQRSPLSLAFFQ